MIVAEAIEGRLLHIGQAASSGTSCLDVEGMLRKLGREVIALAEEFQRGELAQGVELAQEVNKLVDWPAVCRSAIKANEDGDFPELELSDATIDDMRETGRQIEAESLQHVRDETCHGGVIGGTLDRLEKAWAAAVPTPADD